ncbi:carboxypeptidase-like regulatory domain-containing protein [Pontibacter sp. G13]|uniref:TonB-dependent receptor n=1 Tax=Pontibacter sp. G13 TaxID=3074898 RepID=UPI00288C35E2|nr:carboxypeptidase-like regulatory domain-containing protein [Pontibacter sp. G13]WNJ21028.1 carboxypeptidase-like regulatory domain-containing protein [Pontibacter sp. G13]
MKKSLHVHICLLLGFLFLGIAPITAQVGQLRGKIVNEDGEPLVGATVFMPEIKMGSYSDDNGIYSVNKVPVGIYDVMVFYYGYDTLRTEVQVERDQTTTEGFVLKEQTIYTDAVEIVGNSTGEINTTEVEIGVTEITPQEINLMPSLGNPDLVNVLTVQPGIVFSGDQGGQLFIRGGTPIQNMVLLDNMIIYSPFHSIGLFSVFDPDYIRTVDVYSAAFPADYGGRVSSVIDIKSRNGSLKEFKGKFNVSPFMAGAMVEGPLGGSQKTGAGFSYLLSARNLYIDETSTSLYGYVSDTVGIPYNFLDLYGKLSLSDGINFASVFGFRQTDQANYEFAANTAWDAVGGGLNFQILPSGDGAVITGVFAYSNYHTELTERGFPRTSDIAGFNGTLKVGYTFNSVDQFDFSVNVSGFSTDYSFTNEYGYRTDDAASNTEAALAAVYKKVIRKDQGDGRFKDWAVIEPSIRFHFYNNQQKLLAEPRLRAKLNLPRVSLSFGTGLYSQNLLSATSDRDVVNFFQGFLSAPEDLDYRVKSHTLQTAFHLLAGAEFEIVENLSTQAEVWLKDFTQLTNINRDRIFPEEPQYITETGLAKGVDVTLKYQKRNTYFFVTYGLAKSDRTYRLDSEEPVTYPTSFDRRHNVNVVASYRTGSFGLQKRGDEQVKPKFNEPKWEFSLRWNLGSGFPFTQTQGYYESLQLGFEGAETDLATQNGQLGIFLSEDLNQGRLPYYHRLDLSAKRRWLIKNAMLVEVSANVVNAYDRNNIFYFDRVTKETLYQLPVLPSLAATIKF